MDPMTRRGILAMAAGSNLPGQTPQAGARFLPEHWPKEDLSHYLALQNGFDPRTNKRLEPLRSALSSKAMIAGTNHPLAVHAGLEVLRGGGSAADAVVATSLAQIALSAGAAISY